MRPYSVSKSLQKVLHKLEQKDKIRYEATLKKISEIVNTPTIEHYKNLRYSLKDCKRVHIDSSFVLIFTHDKKTDTLSFEDLQHHDDIYKR